MPPKSEKDRIWLVKKSGVVLGPYSQPEVIEEMSQRRVSLLDEVRSPSRRWGYIREQPEYSEAVKAIRVQDDSNTGSTGTETATATATSEKTPGTISITSETNLDDELTPAPTIDAKSDSSIDLASEIIGVKPSNQTVYNESPQLPKKPIKQDHFSTQVRRPNYNLKVIVVMIIALVGIVVSMLMNFSSPSSSGVDYQETIRLARVYRSMGLFEKALMFYSRVDITSRAGQEIRRELTPILITYKRDDPVLYWLLKDLSEKEEPKVSIELMNWKGLYQMHARRFDIADGIYTTAKVTDAKNNYIQTNGLINRFFLKRYDVVWNQFLDAKKQNKLNQFILTSAAMSLLSLNKFENPDIAKSVLEELFKTVSLSNEYKLENLILLASLQAKLRQEKEAELTANRIFEIDPELSGNFVQDLNYFYQIEDWNNIDPYCKQLAESFAQNKNMSQRISLICKIKEGKIPESLRDLEQMNKESGPQKLEGIYSYLLLKSGKLAEIKALPKIENSFLGNYVRSQICLEEKEISCAESSLKAMSQLDPQNPVILLNNIRLSLLMNKKEPARMDLKKALTQYPTFLPLIKLQEEINEI